MDNGFNTRFYHNYLKNKLVPRTCSDAIKLMDILYEYTHPQ